MGLENIARKALVREGSPLSGNFTLPQRGPTAMDETKLPRGSSRLPMPRLRRGKLPA
jgi:hypothetical protein